MTLTERTEVKSLQKDFPVSVEQMWDLLSNTEHLNRVTGLPKIKYDPPSKEAGFYRNAEATLAHFIKFKWKEFPFDWVKQKSYSVKRVFDSGPIKELHVAIELESVSGSVTRVKPKIQVIPRNFIGKLIAPLVAKNGCRDLIKYCDLYMKTQKNSPQQVLPPVSVHGFNRDLFESHLEDLNKNKTLNKKIIDLLVTHIETASDEEVLRIKPYALADRWHQDRHETLRVFLYATKEGIFHLDWELMCPHCRVPKAEYKSLKDVKPTYDCDLCGVTLEVDLERYTELRFSVNPEIRKAVDAVYCIGGPYTAPHVIAQQTLATGSETVFTLTPPKKDLRLRIIKRGHSLVLPHETSQNQNISTHEFSYSSKNGFQSDQSKLGTGQQKFILKNTDSENVIAVIELIDWDETAITAHEVTTFQEFRNLFSSEVLAHGREIGIRNLCLLFTDLKSSTQLYEQIGDASAFSQVMKHFDFLMDHISKNNGAVVKTIGDAVMAAFPKFSDGLKAAIEVQKNLDRFNKEKNISPPIVIKIGLYQGPAIAITSNGRLDYFGRSVNIAARIQNESKGGDIVITKSSLERPDTKKILSEHSATTDYFSMELKGINGHFDLCRLTV